VLKVRVRGDVAELGQQMAAIAAVAAIGLAERGHALEVLIDQFGPYRLRAADQGLRAPTR
jgi:hypothetical protein